MRVLRSAELLFELSRPGRRCVRLPEPDVPVRPLDDLLPADALAETAPPLPELAEPDVVRHYTNLSTMNMAVDSHFYPLGSCTMKYNPKRNERLAGLPGWLHAHPYQPESTLQGLLELLYELQLYLGEISGRRGNEWARRPIGIVFTKADRIEQCMEDPEAFAKAHATGLWEQCLERFRIHKFFAAGVAGACAWRDTFDEGRVQVPLRIEPHGIIEPFEWLLGHLPKQKR